MSESMNPYRDEEIRTIPEQIQEIYDELDSLNRRKVYLLHRLYLLDRVAVERIIEGENS
jgi:hypothetical protein